MVHSEGVEASSSKLRILRSFGVAATVLSVLMTSGCEEEIRNNGERVEIQELIVREQVSRYHRTQVPAGSGAARTVFIDRLAIVADSNRGLTFLLSGFDETVTVPLETRPLAYRIANNVLTTVNPGEIAVQEISITDDAEDGEVSVTLSEPEAVVTDLGEVTNAYIDEESGYVIYERAGDNAIYMFDLDLESIGSCICRGAMHQFAMGDLNGDGTRDVLGVSDEGNACGATLTDDGEPECFDQDLSVPITPIVSAGDGIFVGLLRLLAGGEWTVDAAGRLTMEIGELVIRAQSGGFDCEGGTFESIAGSENGLVISTKDGSETMIWTWRIDPVTGAPVFSLGYLLPEDDVDTELGEPADVDGDGEEDLLITSDSGADSPGDAAIIVVPGAAGSSAGAVGRYETEFPDPEEGRRGWIPLPAPYNGMYGQLNPPTEGEPSSSGSCLGTMTLIERVGADAVRVVEEEANRVLENISSTFSEVTHDAGLSDCVVEPRRRILQVDSSPYSPEPSFGAVVETDEGDIVGVEVRSSATEGETISFWGHFYATVFTYTLLTICDDFDRPSTYSATLLEDSESGELTVSIHDGRSIYDVLYDAEGDPEEAEIEIVAAEDGPRVVIKTDAELSIIEPILEEEVVREYIVGTTLDLEAMDARGSLFSGDVNGDGNQDLMIGGTVLNGDGRGNFDHEGAWDIPDEVLDWVDLNLDGFMEAIVRTVRGLALVSRDPDGSLREQAFLDMDEDGICETIDDEPGFIAVRRGLNWHFYNLDALPHAELPDESEPEEEVCDGRDNDGDGETDEGLEDQPEDCNYRDDNCDGRVDEGFTVGDACYAGIGECGRVGTHRCTADGTGTECIVEPGLPSLELCDILDNDCDGDFDEDELCSECPGVAEICNGIDDDCDGLVDEDDVCECIPVDETCNGIDDDCDDLIDEDFPEVDEWCWFAGADCESDGIMACAPDGLAVECLPAGIETCNEADDDCDGLVDEDDVCGPCVPLAEVCDGVDNDCDDLVDEDFPGLAEPCFEGTGACEGEGVNVCDPATGGVTCTAVPGPPGTEICDGEDNDCNGHTDDATVCTDGCSGDTQEECETCCELNFSGVPPFEIGPCVTACVDARWDECLAMDGDHCEVCFHGSGFPDWTSMMCGLVLRCGSSPRAECLDCCTRAGHDEAIAACQARCPD